MRRDFCTVFNDLGLLLFYKYMFFACQAIETERTACTEAATSLIFIKLNEKFFLGNIFLVSRAVFWIRIRILFPPGSGSAHRMQIRIQEVQNQPTLRGKTELKDR
jgi:hypothetical protein